MIPQPPCRAVFKYEYRPLTMSYRRVPRDGGFSLTVYENNMAVFSMYELTDWGDMHAEVISRNAPRARSTQSVYRLDEEFANRYLAILKRWDSWIRDLDKNICMPEGSTPRYCSRLGFHGYEMITCDEPVLLSQHAPLTSPEGRSARLLMPMFEAIAVLLADYHIHLQFNNWNVDEDVHPVEYQPGSTGQIPPVMPEAMNM